MMTYEQAGEVIRAQKRKVILAWSGGKDSALALHALRQSPEVEPSALLTTVAAGEDLVPMHEVPLSLIRRQAAAAGLPLIEVPFPRGGDNGAYEAAMSAALAKVRASGIESVAFGDLYLADVRAYREQNLRMANMTGVFPLWGRDTRALIDDFVAAGFGSILTCVDSRRLPPAFAGRFIDEAFAASLPAGVDPCGENGEYHSFCFRGPIFQNEIQFDIDKPARRGDFTFVALKERSPQ